MKVSSHNEWDKLRSVIIGSIEGANWPKLDPTFSAEWETTLFKGLAHPAGPVPQHVIEETQEDLETLANTLKSSGITVYRPKPHDFSTLISTTQWTTDQFYSYCPRDVCLVIGETVIEAPMANRSRQFESECLSHIRSDAIKDGVKWFAAPRPMLPNHCYETTDTDVILYEEEPIFDAANVLRMNNDILYLVSATGNRLGGEWLQNILGDQYKVHILEHVYSGAHIDTTISVIREGLVVLAADRISAANCPKVFKNWDKIWLTDPVRQSYYKYPFASKFMAMNLLSIDPNTAIVDSLQIEFIKELERHNIEVWPMTLRHARTLGGGFHCSILDLCRE